MLGRQLPQLFYEPLADAAPDGAAVTETSSFSLEEGNKEKGEDEEGEGSVAGQGVPGQPTAACEDFYLHKTALTLPCFPGSSVWQVARNLQQQHQDLT